MPRLTVFFLTCLIVVCSACGSSHREKVPLITRTYCPLVTAKEKSIGAIALPQDYERTTLTQVSFGEWLRRFPLEYPDTILLYNGLPARYQSWHYAVLDLSVDKQGLQQCADAIMRLRAAYFFERRWYDSIRFPSGQGAVFNFAEYATGTRYRLQHNRIVAYKGSNNTCYSHECLLHFLQTVFAYCGTYTLQQMTKPVPAFTAVQPGDMLVRGGSPGHAMMVCDVAEHPATHAKKYLLLQGYTPAMQVHIVKNPRNGQAWFTVDTNSNILTPGYVFSSSELRRWK